MLFLIIKVMTIINTAPPTTTIHLLNKLPSYCKQDSGDVMQTFNQQNPSRLSSVCCIVVIRLHRSLSQNEKYLYLKVFFIVKCCAVLKKFLFSFPFLTPGLETVPPSPCFFTHVIFICYLIILVFKLLLSFSFWAYIIIHVLPRGKLT